MNNSKPPQKRAQLTDEEIAKMKPSDLRKIKLTDDELMRVRALNIAREEARKARYAKVLEEQAPIAMELRAAGLDITNLSDLLSISEPYPDAIPILLRHLVKPYSDITRATIARALASPEPKVRNAWPLLVEEYRKAPTGAGIVAPGDTAVLSFGAKDGLACALSAAVSDKTLDELITLLKDTQNGESRLLLLEPLKRRRKKSAKIQQVLDELEHDPDLCREISRWNHSHRAKPN
jgi:hypothetical protein